MRPTLPSFLYPLKDGKAVTDAMPLLCMKDLCLAEDMKMLPDIADSAKIEGRMKSPEYTGVVTKVYKKALSGEINKQEIQNMLSFPWRFRKRILCRTRI